MGRGRATTAAPKGGIITMTLVHARELQRYNVTVNVIAPRARTPMTESNPKFTKPEEGFDKYDPANVSPMVAFLASDAAGDISGQAFIVLGDQVHRMQPTTILATVTAGQKQWTVDELIDAKDRLLAGAPSGVPVWGGPPM